ncbi:SitI6 family double-CXXCG motif immunity protein [Pyxidicoccus xibeiensis]|uniref:SitI6 family double-CXXCG motif immunity protein n=1 Tax=Pyxidicoccus xibeiensis TaxID=2906759 RepID=UPI0020A78907|nr:double-CXXCG motif protein [Pyxidicoccus xibeiensis]MCP3136737.1 hypothetical protein [Pyxidicoccus xibeiensis]
MKFYEVREDADTQHTGTIDGVSPWCIPSVACALCGGHGGLGEAYSTVDLSGFPERGLLEEARSLEEISLETYQELCELLRPRVPAGAPLVPGTQLGPVTGKSSGRFGDFYFQAPWALWASRETLEKLQASGMRGLHGAPGDLRYRGKHPPELFDLEIQVRGSLHPSCYPSSWQAPCSRCGSHRNSYPAEAPVLDGTTLPEDGDLFRLREFETIIIANERFVDAVKRLQLGDILFRELLVR